MRSCPPRIIFLYIYSKSTHLRSEVHLQIHRCHTALVQAALAVIDMHFKNKIKIYCLEQGLANSFWKGSGSKYFWLSGHI